LTREIPKARSKKVPTVRHTARLLRCVSGRAGVTQPFVLRWPSTAPTRESNNKIDIFKSIHQTQEEKVIELQTLLQLYI
jgi:hypothetical protein